MCKNTILENKYVLFGLICYILPSIVVWGIVFYQTPHSGPLTFDIWFFGFLLFFVESLIWMPIVLTIFLPYIMIPYFVTVIVVAYIVKRRGWKIRIFQKTISPQGHKE
jgi:hypothetical protein